MAHVDGGVPPITGRWKIADIIYVSLVALVMLAAVLEWCLGLAAFLFCLIKAFQKAEARSTRILAVIMIIVFCSMRGIFLPVMIVTLPLPAQVSQYFPKAMVSFLQWFAFWTFAGLLTIPWLFCIYQLVTNSLGRKKRIKETLDEGTAPKVVIVMPCYKEVPEVLVTAIDSVVGCDYPPACLHVFLSFDGDQQDELYLQTIEKLGIPLIFDDYPPSIDVTYRDARITISRFPHGGKRQCQKRTYHLINKIYTKYLQHNDDLFLLFIDSDCILDKVCIQNFVYEMELKPGSEKNMLAMTGVITSTTQKNSLITLLQDMEYIHGQLFERSVESGCGAVTCLPGALTILRFSAFREISKWYFGDSAEVCDDLFDYGKTHLGEDRWLTHLLMIGAQHRYQIGMCTGAFCKTEAVQTYKSLLKQRRRWFLGFITNEACMLTDVRLWRTYPLLCFIRLMQNTIRTTALLFFIMVLSIATTSNKVKNLPVGFIGVSLGLNWMLMFYFGLRLRRYKIWCYPIMFVVNPFFNWVYMIYGICTAGQRTWGGPRADAGVATAKTSPQEAIEHAEATGDDLNVVPESFRPAMDSVLKRSKSVPLQPPNRVAGRFKPSELHDNGIYQSPSQRLRESRAEEGSSELLSGRRPNFGSRDSVDSFQTGVSGSISVMLPRPLASLMAEEAMQRHRMGQPSRPETQAMMTVEPSSPATGAARVDERFDRGELSDRFELSNLEEVDLGERSPPGSIHGEDRRPASREGSMTHGYMPVQHDLPEPSALQPRFSSEARLSVSTNPHLPATRSSVASRIARSPLGQLSFSRSSDHGSSIELRSPGQQQQQQQQEQRLMEELVRTTSEPVDASIPAEVREEKGEKKRKKLMKRWRKS